MRFFNGSMTAFALAISLSACGNNNNENAKDTTEKKAIQSAVSTATLTDSKSDSGFKDFLSSIPADTAYLVTNKKIMSKEVIDFNLQRVKQSLSMWLTMLEDEVKKNTVEVTDDEKSEEQNQQTKTAKETADNNKLNVFFIALLKDIQANLSVDKMANIGMKVDGHSALYGVDLAPVFRYEITNKKAVKETISRAEKVSGYPVEWKQCGDYSCIELTDESAAEPTEGLVIVLLDNQVAGGLFSADNKTALINHLTTKSKPEASYSIANWNSFLGENGYKGYGDGFIDLNKIYKTIEKQLIKQEKTVADKSGEAFDEKSFKACSALVYRHIEHIPEAIFGITEIKKEGMDFEILLKTSTDVSSAISAIPNSLEGMQQATDPIFDLGLNINFGKLRDALTQYTSFLIKTAEEVHCDDVNSADIRKAMGGFTMATMMGAGQFKAVYIAVNDLKMDATEKPEKVDLYASVFADHPGALLQILGMVNPAFATINLKNDGTPTRLPKGLVPENPTGFTPEIYLSKKDHLLNIMVGDTKPALKPFKTDNPAFFWNTVDNKRYYQLMSSMMGESGNSEPDEETKKAIEMMSKMGSYSGKVHTQIGANSRGVVIHYSVEYADD